MYFKNKIGSVTKTKNGVIFEDLHQTITLEFKPCEDMHENIDMRFKEYVSVLKAEVIVQGMINKNNPTSD
ncbi:hypothetical protein [Enterococcus bulliens]